MLNRKTIIAFATSLLIIATIACGGATPTATPDVQMTVEASIAATETAQADVEATVAAAVEATSVAAPTPVDVPTPTPSAEYVTMTEEELVALIDQAVTEATVATQQCSTAVTDATTDDNVTQEEVDTVTVYVTGAEEAIAYAEELLYIYYDLYGDLATEALETLQMIEQDLVAVADSTAAVAAALEEINTTLQQGLELAEETIAQLESAAEAASAKAAEIQAQNQARIQDLQAEIETRMADALAVQPNDIATDRAAAVQSAFDYLDTARRAMDDGRVSQDELANIAQLGANAAASLNAHGGPQLQQLSGSINEITAQIARGQMPQASASLGNLAASLGTRPHRSRP